MPQVIEFFWATTDDKVAVEKFCANIRGLPNIKSLKKNQTF